MRGGSVITDTDWGYPVCGPGRLPVKDDKSIFDIASSTVPRTNISTTGSGYVTPYPYSTPAPPAAVVTPSPYYYYWDFPRCACAGGTVPGTPIVATPPAMMNSTVAGGKARFLDDTLFSIMKSGWDGKPIVPYGPVPIANDNGNAINPRLGASFQSGTSSCHCPNVNEKEVPLSSTADPLSGTQCVPALDAWATDPSSVKLIKFKPAYHDGAQSIVMNRATEAKDTSNNVVTRIKLPTDSDTYQLATAPYERGIWVCQSPLTMNPANGTCTFVDADNACDATSEVSPKIPGATFAARFNNTINKKLNCCGFQFGSAQSLGASPVKFDCVGNENFKYPNFNTLWASRDDDSAGGRLNAIVLYGKGGRELTGWYTLEGRRCNQYPSLSNTPIVPGTVNPNLVVTQQAQLAAGVLFQAANDVKYHTWSGGAWAPAAPASSIQMPSGAEWTDLTSKLALMPGMQAPPNPNAGTAAEVRKAIECPVYVRAAAVYGCQENAVGSSEKRLFETTDAAGRKVFRCAAAARTQIHMRIEQVYVVAGSKPQKTIDTILDATQTRNITLKELWQVNGFGKCPAGGTQVGDACAW